MKEKAKAMLWSGLYLCISVAVMLGLSIMLGALSVVLGMNIGIISAENQQSAMELIEAVTGYLQQGTPLMIFNCICDGVLLTCFGTWYYFREKKYKYHPDYKRAFRLKNILYIAGLAFFGQYALNLFMVFVSIALPNVFEKYMELVELLDMDSGNALVMIFAVVLFGPLAEEVLFRGMVFGKLRRAFRFWPSAIISGVLFGIYHMNLVQGIYAAVFGVLLAYIFEKTETIWGPYLLHVMFNGSTYVIEGYEGALTNAGVEIPAAVTLAISVVSLVIVVFLAKNFGKPGKKAMKDVNNSDV